MCENIGIIVIML